MEIIIVGPCVWIISISASTNNIIAKATHSSGYEWSIAAEELSECTISKYYKVIILSWKYLVLLIKDVYLLARGGILRCVS